MSIAVAAVVDIAASETLTLNSTAADATTLSKDLSVLSLHSPAGIVTTATNHSMNVAPQKEPLLVRSPAIAYRAAPGLRLTVEGSDGRRHTYDDKGNELGNDIYSGVYDTVEIEDMTFDSVTETYSYPCPCGDYFKLAVSDMMDGDDIARCPSCTLLIRVIYDPSELFEEESDSDSD